MLTATRLRATEAASPITGATQLDWSRPDALATDGWTLVTDPSSTATTTNAGVDRATILTQPHAVRFGDDFPDIRSRDRMRFDHPVPWVADITWDVDGDPIPQVLPLGGGATVVPLKKVTG